eukprot:TRINITY_DN16949_c0_g1_i1.p1 TRINITY_DN16949_c0_g1~~TRINITY_DN16949_c0_g1_i1.p1  ORF type:complete len:423 (+),score=116.44 TRINITY_DN16949_c0_g1_i1:59-1270(+)
MRAAAAARSPGGGLRKTVVNPGFDGQQDGRELHAIDQRVFLDTERQKRIFDPKVRTIGIDKQRLDQQVYERQDLKRLEQEREDWLDKQMVLEDKHAQALQAESELIRLQKDRDVQWYRDTYQKKRAGREWDLNDPDGKKKDLPARVSDDDPRCGPSSMQKFDGEDADRLQRLKEQQDELRRFLDRQIEEKNLKNWRDNELDRLWEERAEEVKRKIFEAERLAKLQRQQATQTTADFNKALADQRRREAELAKERDAMQKMQDIENQLNSKFLNELDDVLINGRRSNAKGLHRDQLQAIYNQQAQQLEELRQKRIRDAEDERMSAARAEQERAMSLMLEKKLHEEKRELRRKLDSENAQQRYLQLLKEAERKRLYAQEVGEQFFEPFCPPNYHDGKPDKRKPTR